MTRNRPIPHISEADLAFIRSLVIHEDEAMLVFNKPSGLPSQVRGNKAQNLDHLLWAFAKSNGKRPRLVHRLDAGTSGVIIAGKTKPATTALAQQFERRSAKKTYLAIVSGMLPSQDRGTIDVPIARIETDRGSKIVTGHPGGRLAKTKWQIISRAEDTALMELQPLTGRMHQIRVHLAHLGCPILGDRIYGETASAPRLMLHAGALTLKHPTTQEAVTFRAPLPRDFVGLCERKALEIPDGDLFRTD